MQLVPFLRNHILKETIRILGKLTYCLGVIKLAVKTGNDYFHRYFSFYRPGYEGVSPLDFSRAPNSPVSLVSCRKQTSTGKKGRDIEECTHRVGESSSGGAS